MTAQAGDRIIYQGIESELPNTPLQSYFTAERPAPAFRFTNTGNWRGYIASWEITPQGELFLTELNGQLADGSPASVGTIFPGQTRVFAEWVNEVLGIPRGPLLKTIHHGLTAVYEKELLVTITRGRVESVVEFFGKDMLDSPITPF